jgi:hypothetical protein
MKLEFIPTIGGQKYYYGDTEDEGAPVLEMNFCSDLARLLTDEQKEQIAYDALNVAIEKTKAIMVKNYEAKHGNESH